MEQLLAFVFKYWYLVLIGLTFWYQIQNKGRRSANQKPSKPGMPSFGGAPGQGQQMPVPNRQQSRPSATPRGSQDEQGRSKSAAEASPKASPFSAPKPAVQDNSSVYASDLTNPGAFPDSPNREQLVQGIVWAEILGPPRSKKPYRK